MQLAEIQTSRPPFTTRRAAFNVLRFLARVLLFFPLFSRLLWLEFALRQIDSEHAGVAELIFERNALHTAMKRSELETARVLLLQLFTDSWKRC